MAKKTHSIAPILLLLCLMVGHSMAKIPHFEAFYPQDELLLHSILSTNCTVQYQAYRDGYPKAIFSLVTCIYKQHGFDQLTESNTAAAAVVLGILPTILSFAGSTTVETGMLAIRRPFLAFLLSAGAPAVNPTRAFDYRDTADLLQTRPKSYQSPAPRNLWKAGFISFLQYALALGAVANVVDVSLTLGIRTVASFAAETVYNPILWATIAVGIHIAGAIAVQLRLQLVETSAQAQSNSHKLSWRRRLVRHFISMFREEFSISGVQAPATLELREEGLLFLFLSWLLSVGTVIHIIYGTLVFSGTLFISTQDATGVAGRYVGSTVACRIVLAYEFSGMRQSIDPSAAQVYVRMDQKDGTRGVHGPAAYSSSAQLSNHHESKTVNSSSSADVLG